MLLFNIRSRYKEFMSKALDLTRETFKSEVLESELPVLVDFWAPWCQPCQMMAPILDELAGEVADKIKIAKLDTENPMNQELAIQYQIQSIPNMKVFKEGKVVGEIIGLRSKESLMEEINNILQ